MKKLNNKKTCKKERGGDKKHVKKENGKYLNEEDWHQEHNIPDCNDKPVNKKVV